MTVPLSAEQRDLLALHLVPGLGPRLTAALPGRSGSAAAGLRATADELRQVPHIGAKLSQELAQAMTQIDVAAELALLERHQVRVLTPGTPPYPVSLTPLADRPPLLYLRGSVEADANAVALVGSRHCTAYGKRVAERLAAGLVRAGCTVVSGLARGIDAAAHRGTPGRRSNAGGAGRRPHENLSAGAQGPGPRGRGGRWPPERGHDASGADTGHVSAAQSHHQRPVVRRRHRRGSGEERAR